MCNEVKDITNTLLDSEALTALHSLSKFALLDLSIVGVSLVLRTVVFYY